MTMPSGPMTSDDVALSAKRLYEMYDVRRPTVERIYRYLRDDPDSTTLEGVPENAPHDIKRVARYSRINLLKFVLNSRVQHLYVDNYKVPGNHDSLRVWKDAWQANRMDFRQIGINRSTLAYGLGYSVSRVRHDKVWIRGASPKELVAGMPEGEPDADWPELALWYRGNGMWWLLDSRYVYRVSNSSGAWVMSGEAEAHGMTFEGRPVCPVVRYTDTCDLDDPERGIIDPLTPLQDQINATTFALQVAQRFGAFRQLLILGWAADNAAEIIKGGAFKAITLDVDPNEVNIQQLAQTDLSGYINSREASVKHMATVGQAPVQELLGELVNLSAEALETLRASFWSAIGENQRSMADPYEQQLALASEALRQPVDPNASVRWADTRIQNAEQAIRALGLLVQELGVPARALWDRVPDAADHDLAEWRKIADREGDAVAQMQALADQFANAQAVSNGAHG